MNPEKTMSLRQRFLGAGFWSAGSQAFLTVFGMGVTVILARLLMPQDYGLLAMAMVFIGLLNQTNVVGFGHALVRMKEITPESEKLTFTYALLSGFLMCGVVFALAPAAGAFYADARVVPLLRVMSLGFIIRAFYIVPHSLLRRKFRMKQQAKIQVLATLIDAVTTVLLAWMGFGVWALAVGPLVASAVQVAGIALVCPWAIGFQIRGGQAKELIRFAGGVNLSILLWYWYVSADSLIIGRMLGSTALGIFAMAMNLSKLSWNKVWMAVNPILLPLFTEARGKEGELGRVFLKVNYWVALMIFPAAFGMISVAPEIVTVLLSAKWSAVIIPLQWLCLLGVSRGLVVLMSPVILALGRVRLEVMFSLVCGVVLPLVFVLVQPYGVNAIAAAWAMVFPVLAAVVLLPLVLRALGLRLGEYLRVLRTPFLASLAMVAILYALQLLIPGPPSILLVVKILAGAGIYLGLITLLEGSPYHEFRRLLADTRTGARA